MSMEERHSQRDKIYGIKRYVNVSELERKKGIAIRILKNSKNYLSANQREDLRKLIEGKIVLRYKNIKKLENIVNARKRRNFPDFWEERLEGGSDIALDVDKCGLSQYDRFPTVDFIIQFGAGVYNERRIINGMLRDEGHPRGIVPSRYRDVEKFLENAVYEDKIHPVLKRDIIYWTQTRFSDSRTKKERTISAFESIEEKIKGKGYGWSKEPGRKRSDEDLEEQLRYRGDEPWYLDLTPEECKRTAEIYLKKIKEGKGMELNEGDNPYKERSFFDRMAYLFPGVFKDESFEGIKEEKRRDGILERIRSGDLSTITDSEYKICKDEVDEVIRKRYWQMVEKDKLFIFRNNKGKISKAMGINYNILRGCAAETFNELRLQNLGQISDEELMQNKKGTYLNKNNSFSSILKYRYKAIKEMYKKKR